MYIHGTDYPTPDGTCVRDYIHVDDLAQAHLDALDYLERGGASTVLNCGYGHGHSVREVIEAVRKASGVDFRVEEGPRRPGDPSALVASNRRIGEVLGWRPRHDDLEYIVGTAWRWEHKLHAHGGPEGFDAARDAGLRARSELRSGASPRRSRCHAVVATGAAGDEGNAAPPRRRQTPSRHACGH